MNVLMGVAVTLTCALILFLIVYILYKGLPNITWELLSTSPSYLSGTIGILPDILNTVYLVLATLVFVLPLGVGAAIYLTEYAKNKRIVAIIEYAFGHTVHHLRTCRNALFLPIPRIPDINNRRRADACYNEPAHGYENHAGKPENRPAELP